MSCFKNTNHEDIAAAAIEDQNLWHQNAQNKLTVAFTLIPREITSFIERMDSSVAGILM